METLIVVGVAIALIGLIVFALTRKSKDPQSGERREPPRGGQ